MIYGPYTRGSVISSNVSYKREIDEETLLSILSGQIQLLDEWESHLVTFFNELPAPFIIGVMDENGLNLYQLTEVFEALPKVFQFGTFKEMLNCA